MLDSDANPMNSLKERTLESLCKVGSVRGVCLARGGRLLDSRFPFSERRVQALCQETQQIVEDFAARGRPVERLVIGFDGGQLLVVVDGDLRLLLMHMNPDEADFVAKAARAFLLDFRKELNGEVAAEVEVVPDVELDRAVSEPLPKTAARPSPPKPRQPKPAVVRQNQNRATDSAADALWLEDFGKIIADAEDEANAREGEEGDTNRLPAADLASADETVVTGVDPPPRKADLEKATVGSVVVHPARLAAHQPQSTLPPQKKPRIRRGKGTG